MIPNWPRFQHYKDRNPHWIKGHLEVLYDDAYMGTPLAQRGLLEGIWKLYASTHGVLSITQTKRLLCTNKGDSRHFQRHLVALSDAGFIEICASKPLALRSESASPEKEKEKEPQTPEGALAPEPANAARRAHREDTIQEALRLAAEWNGGGSDEFHERLDELEHEDGVLLTDQERMKIVDVAISAISRRRVPVPDDEEDIDW